MARHLLRPAWHQRMMMGGGAAPVVPWYNAGGAPDPIAAYQPKGAASLAASYINLVNPGTYNAAPGVAPTWDTVNGWIFNGSTQYLTTGLNPQGTWSVLIQFTSWVNANSYLAGAQSSGNNYQFESNTGNLKLANAASSVHVSAHVPNGNIAIAGPAGYVNGAPAVVLAGTGNTSHRLYLGANNLLDIIPTGHANVKIQAVAIYNVTLTAPQVLAVSTRMAAL